MKNSAPLPHPYNGAGAGSGEIGGVLYSSSMLGWKMRFTKPMLGLLYGYWSGSSTWTFQRPPVKGAKEAGLSASVVRTVDDEGRTFFGALEADVELLPLC